MPLGFNLLLEDAGIAPAQVLLLRHQDGRSKPGRTPFCLWRDDRAAFEDYQSRQRATSAPRFGRAYWASFIAEPDGSTVFAGLYQRTGQPRKADTDWVAPHSGEVILAGKDIIYPLERTHHLTALEGLLYIDWGDAARVWTQRADRHDKQVTALRRAIREPDFPGYAGFMSQLSELERLPLS